MKRTDKFNEMISFFQGDLTLAKEGVCKLSDLDVLIQNKDPKLLADINLMEELAYKLRTGEAAIYIKQNN